MSDDTASTPAAETADYDVFISYAREDAPRALALADALEARKLRVIGDWHLLPGDDWATVLGIWLGRCKAVVVLWSQHSLPSEQVFFEAKHAANRGCQVP